MPRGLPWKKLSKRRWERTTTRKTNSAPPKDSTTTATLLKQEANSKPCHFFRLPPELRNHIYELALLGPSTKNITCLHPTNHYCSLYAAQPNKFQIPALLRTNHQIRAEASSIFFSDTNFHCHGTIDKLGECLDVLDRKHVELIKRIESSPVLKHERDAIDWLRWAHKELKDGGILLGKDVLQAVCRNAAKDKVKEVRLKVKKL